MKNYEGEATSILVLNHDPQACSNNWGAALFQVHVCSCDEFKNDIHKVQPQPLNGYHGSRLYTTDMYSVQ